MRPLAVPDVKLRPVDPKRPHGEQAVEHEGRELFRISGPEADILPAALAGWNARGQVPSEIAPRHAALLQVIRSFKQPEDSDLDAALNVVVNHAATIARLIGRAAEPSVAEVLATARAAQED
jgi:hypothetical protein